MKTLVDSLRGSASVKHVRSPWHYSQTAKSLNQWSKQDNSFDNREMEPEFICAAPVSARGPQGIAARTRTFRGEY